jgi:hypothetical protein
LLQRAPGRKTRDIGRGISGQSLPRPSARLCASGRPAPGRWSPWSRLNRPSARTGRWPRRVSLSWDDHP